MFDFDDPELGIIAQALHRQITPSGVLIYEALRSAAGIRLRVLAATNSPIGQPLDPILPPEKTIGSLVVELNREIVIQDTLIHPLIKDTGAVSQMGIMAYIGVPCRYNGVVVGGVSVVESHQRNWTAQEIGATREAAAKFEQLVHARHQRNGIGR